MNNKNIIFWIGGILLVILLANQFQLGEFAIYSGGKSNQIIFLNQRGDRDFIEGDLLGVVHSGEPDWSTKYTLVFINDKYYSGDKNNFGFYHDWLGVEFNDKVYPSDKLEPGQNFVEVFYIPRASDCYRLTGGGRPGEPCDTNPRYDNIMLNVRPLPCVLGENQLLAVESFSGNTVISEDSLRFDVVKYCSIHPPIVVDAFTKTSYTNLDILTKLKNKQTITVPSDKVYSIFYVLDNSDEKIPGVLCNPTQAYNIDEERCEDAIGFIQVCSSGTFDPATGICTIQPESKRICPEDGYYDLAQGVCIIHPETKADCPSGTEYNEELNICWYEPEIKELCTQGQWDSEKNACIITPDIDYFCLQGEKQIINGTVKCTIEAEFEYKCLSGFNFNRETMRCEKFGQHYVVDDDGVEKDNKIVWIVGGLGLAGLLIWIMTKKR